MKITMRTNSSPGHTFAVRLNNRTKIILMIVVHTMDFIPTAVMLLVMDSIYTKANDSDLVSLGEGFCRRRRRRRFP